jgi:MFS superfamily sulfate permease-like transporter
MSGDSGNKYGVPGIRRFSRRRLALAFAMAGLADGISFFLTLTPPLQWAIDLVTAILLFVVLGWQWILLPGLIMEAIPGLYVFPFWVLVVGAAAMWGTARPKMKG